MKRLLPSLFTLFVLTSCGTSTPPLLFDPLMGTCNCSDDGFTGTTLLIEFGGFAKPPSDLSIEISGPKGWNQNQVLRESRIPVAEDYKGVRFREYRFDRIEAISGEYLVKLNVDDKSYQKLVEVNADDLLAKVANVVTGTFGFAVSAVWEPSEGSKAYYGRLYESPPGGSPEPLSAMYVDAPEVVLPGQQRQGFNYYIDIVAFNFSPDKPDDLPKQFNASAVLKVAIDTTP